VISSFLHEGLYFNDVLDIFNIFHPVQVKMAKEVRLEQLVPRAILAGQEQLVSQEGQDLEVFEFVFLLGS